MTSNIGQSYPYSSESEAERASAIAALLEAREGLADKIKVETTPLDDAPSRWVYKCPTKGCTGLLHAAGYAAEKRAVYVVCDGSCARTYLR